MKQTLLISLLLFVLVGCQKVIDADNLLDTEERVSILSFISPSDTVLRVDVSKILPAIGTPIKRNQDSRFPEEFLITDALVTLSNANGDETVLTYAPETNNYLSDAANLAIVSGQQYFLNVVVNGTEYNATCTIPQNITEITETISFGQDEFGSERGNVSVSFNDFANEQNFYVLGGFLSYTFQFSDGDTFIGENLLSFETDELKTDNLNDGGTLGGSSELFIGNRENIASGSITIQVAHVEEFLFQHLRTAATNADADGNPFVEYAISPNNILDTGALGIFAGYAITEKTIDIPLN